MATQTAKYEPQVHLGNKELIDDSLWQRLVKRIMRDHGYNQRMSEQIMDQALGYLHLVSDFPGGYVPARLPDIGWHTFILYTREYAAFCQRFAGRFIHHSPNDDPAAPPQEGSPKLTAEAMRGFQISVIDELWQDREPAKCGQCENGCGPSAGECVG